MKKSFLTFALVAFFAFAVAAQSASVTRVTVSVGAGEHWKARSTPQFALWLEDESGNFVRTLYVTAKTGKKAFAFSPKEGRPEALPVWYAASGGTGSASKGSDAGVDAVTSATPKGGVNFAFDLDERTYVIKAEFNTSFDYNDFYTKKNSGVNGQPSVVYQAVLSAAMLDKGEVHLEFAGTGSLDGSDGKVHDADARLTTAREIVRLVTVSR